MTHSPDALIAALVEIERHVGHGGWDQPARLFALVDARAFVAAEPEFAASIGIAESAKDAPEGNLMSIEQEDFHQGEELADALAQIGWPDAVVGCALAVERTMLPADAEAELPEDPVEAARVANAHPRKEDIRIVAGALRAQTGGARHALARMRTAGELLSNTELAPDLERALAATLDD